MDVTSNPGILPQDGVTCNKKEGRMALVQLDFESQYLNSNTTVGIILPDRPREVDAASFYGSGGKYRVLWLLHGTYGDWSDWVRKSMIELYASELDLICVMPSALNSDYASWPSFALGYDMASHLVKELMPLVQNWFPASSRREDNFIAGLSMGGLGALSYILRYPELFSSGAILSACPARADRWDWDGSHPERRNSIRNGRFVNQVANAGGKDAYIKENDLYSMIFRMAQDGTLPPLFLECGTDDAIFYDDFRAFRDEAWKKGLPIIFREREGYGHEWRLWDLAIQDALAFFGLQSKK